MTQRELIEHLLVQAPSSLTASENALTTEIKRLHREMHALSERFYQSNRTIARLEAKLKRTTT